jgi:hypothetical protein
MEGSGRRPLISEGGCGQAEEFPRLPALPPVRSQGRAHGRRGRSSVAAQTGLVRAVLRGEMCVVGWSVMSGCPPIPSAADRRVGSVGRRRRQSLTPLPSSRPAAQVRRGAGLRCRECGLPGATLGCLVPECRVSLHLPCALRPAWGLDLARAADRQFHCPRHRPPSSPAGAEGGAAGQHGSNSGDICSGDGGGGAEGGNDCDKSPRNRWKTGRKGPRLLGRRDCVGRVGRPPPLCSMVPEKFGSPAATFALVADADGAPVDAPPTRDPAEANADGPAHVASAASIAAASDSRDDYILPAEMPAGDNCGEDWDNYRGRGDGNDDMGLWKEVDSLEEVDGRASGDPAAKASILSFILSLLGSSMFPNSIPSCSYSLLHAMI